MVSIKYIKGLIRVLENSDKKIGSLEVSGWVTGVKMVRRCKEVNYCVPENGSNQQELQIISDPVKIDFKYKYIKAPASGLIHYHPDVSNEFKIDEKTNLGVVDHGDKHKNITSKFKGAIEKCLVEENKVVTKGQKIIKVRLDNP
jgi:biotin carboxyl carrier protein